MPAIAGYEHVRRIGRGGSATVYLAREAKHDRLVAIKVLHPVLTASIQAERFLREIAIIASLAHPNIIPLLDSGRIGDTLYYITPYVPGESLRKRLERERTVPIEDAVRLTKEVAGALDYAHRRGLVHRDIKPENILLADGHALVADFGIARALSLAADDDLTTTGLAVGTVRYMSPEQAQGRAVDQRSDIYSLGCVLFEMVAATFPPSSREGIEALGDTGLTWSDRLRKRGASTIPPQLRRVLDVALEPQPGRRFTSAAAMIAELEDESRTGGLVYRVRRVFVAQPLAAAVVVIIGAGAVAIALGAGESLTWFAHVRADTTRIAIFPAGADSTEAPSRARASALHEAIAGWRGIDLVDQFQTNDAIERLDGALTVRTARQFARSLGAGRFILVRVEGHADSARLHAALYNVAGPQLLYQLSESIPAESTAGHDALARVAQRLLLRGASLDTSNASFAGSRSLPAVQAFGRAQDSLTRWDLQSAEAAFEQALVYDPAYARANLWLAQVKAWRGRTSSGDWLTLAERAVIAGAVLSHRERLLASALVSLARRRFDEACSIYDDLRRLNDRDFGAWYGLGQCRSMDDVAVRDTSSPSGWRMRSSYHASVTAYEEALELLPSAYAGYEHERFEGIRRLVLVGRRLVPAVAAPPDTGRFWARLALLGDTLALVPYPWSVVSLGGPASVPPGFVEAQSNRAAYFRRLTAGWSSAFPNRAGPKVAVASALELLGDPLAIDTMALARRLVTDRSREVQLAAATILLRVKFGPLTDARWWHAVRRSADSLLRALDPTADDAEVMSAIAALLGRCGTAQAWTRHEPRSGVLPISRELQQAADLHLIRSALGCRPVTDVPDLHTLVDQVARESRDVLPGTRSFVTALVLQRPALFAWPFDSAALEAVAQNSEVPLIHAARALARHDTAVARAAIARHESQYVEAMGTTPDVAYPAARIHLALGDTIGAVTQLDRTLSALRSYDPGALNESVVTAMLLRSMALRSDLARASGDSATARQWTGIVAALWASADEDLMPILRRMDRH